MSRIQNFGSLGFDPGTLTRLAAAQGGASSITGGPGHAASARAVLRGINNLPGSGFLMRNPATVTQRQQFDTQQGNRQQMLRLLGLDQLGEGGLLGTDFFSSILGNTAPDVAGGVAGALSPILGGGGGSGGNIGQPGFREEPGTTAPLPGAGASRGGGSLFDQLLAARGQLGSDILGDISQFGGSQRTRINEDFRNVGNTARARIEDRGFGSSSLSPVTDLGVERGRQRALGSLEDQLLGQRIGAKSQIGEGIFGDIGREQDRDLERRRLGVGLVGNLLGSAINVL